MSTYYEFYIGLLILSLLVYIVQRNLRSKFYLILTGSVLILFSGLRADYVGTDTPTYHRIFDVINFTNSSVFNATKQAGIQKGIEVGYLFLNRLVYFFKGDFHVFIFIVASITVFGFLYYVYTYSPNYLMSIYIYIGMGYYFLSFNINRQFLGTAIAYLGIAKIEKRWQSLIIIIIGGLMHSSAFLILPIWFLTQLKHSKFIHNSLIISILLLIVPVYFLSLRILGDSLKYNMYISEGGSAIGFLNVSMLLFMIILYIVFLKNFDYTSRVDYIVSYSFMFAIIFLFFSIINHTFGRLQYVYMPMMMVDVPYIISHTPLKKYSFLVSLLFILIGFETLNSIPNNDGYGIVPYGIN